MINQTKTDWEGMRVWMEKAFLFIIEQTLTKGIPVF